MKNILLILAALFLVSCASVNPYEVPEGEGAYLKNWKEVKGESEFDYVFKDAVTTKGKKRFEHDQYTANNIYKIPSGEITLGLVIYYYPEGMSVRKFFSLAPQYHIWVANPKYASSGLEGIKINDILITVYD